MPSSAARPPFSFFLSIALLSAAVLGFEVALTRVFAVLLRYQFAFLVISLAVCGLGLGGLWSHFARRKKPLSLPVLALAFGIGADAALFLILRGVFAFRPDQYWLAALLVLVPFGLAGAFLSELFTRFPQSGGRLYGWDLAGAALAAGGCVAVMQGVGAINACLLFAALGALAGAFASQKRAPFVAAALVLALAVPLNRTGIWSVQPIPPMPMPIGESREILTLDERGITQPLYTELGDPRHGSKIVDTRWNAFARTDVVQDPVAPDSFLLYTNGNVPTNMMRWDGKLGSIPALTSDFRLSDWTFGSANLKGKNVLSIGPGGGLDALLALRYGAQKFEGAEINPSIVALMREPKYVAWNGGIYNRPEINVQTADGRAFVREKTTAGQRYRLLFSALTKTATAGQGMALLESFIYTQNAFSDYLDALEPDGQMAIVGDQPLLLARLFVTALAELQRRGLDEKAACRQIAIVYDATPGPYTWSLVVRKTPFPVAQTFDLEQSALQKGLTPILIPDQAATNEIPNVGSIPFQEVAEGRLKTAEFVAFFRKNGFDVSPCPDNRPFVLDLGLSPVAAFTSSPALAILVLLSVGGTVLLAAFSLRGPGGFSAHRAGWVGYFLALGVGFMLVEIPLIQKLILPLGYPTLALTVILFAILLGGGAGALWSQKFEGDLLRRRALFCALGVAIFTVVFALFSSSLAAAMLNLGLVARCGVAVLVLFPLGFLLGVPFPSGLRLFAGDEPDAPPLIWALNGVASVAGSLGAAIGAKMGGFSAVMLVGAAIYLGAAAVLALQKEPAA